MAELTISGGELDLQRLREKSLDPRPEVRASVVETLIDQDSDEARTLLLQMLSFGAWADRRKILEALRTRYRHINAAAVLELMGDAAPETFDRPPASSDAAEHQARLHAELALVLQRRGARDLARSHCQRALALAPGGSSLARAQALHFLGLISIDEGHWQRAAESLQSALGLYQHLAERIREAQVLDSLGSVHFRQLHLFDAEHFFRRSLSLKTETHDLMGLAIAHGSLGRIALLRGDYEQALDHFLEDRAIAAQLGDDHGLATMGNHLAETYLALGEPERARQSLVEGLQAASRSPIPKDVAFCERMLAVLALEQGDAARAAEHVQTAMDIFRAQRDQAELTETRLLAGACERSLGNLESAGQGLALALEEFELIGDPAGEAEALLELSLVHQRSGDADAQSRALRQGLAIAEKLGPTAIRLRLQRTYAHLEAGRLLRDAGVAPPSELERLLEASYRTGRGLGSLLVGQGIVEAEAYERFLKETEGIPEAPAELLQGPGLREAIGLLPRKKAERLLALPFQVVGRRLRVAMADPLDFQAVGFLEMATGLKVERCFLPRSELMPLLEQAYRGPRLGLDRCSDGRTALLVLIERAVALDASDLHIEQKRDGARLRVRIDGVLHELDRVGTERGMQMISSLKILADMSITQKRLPQSSRATWEAGDVNYDLRVSSLPTLHGEKLVVRILRRQDSFSLDELGLDASTVAALRRLLNRTASLLLVVGPTGSGKTTTLYAALQELDSLSRSICTVEDPVEYEISSFTQTQIHPAIGFDFADALKSLLRQDPDVVLLGEIRDLESASIGARFALTGHTVMSTLHTNDAASAVTRLVEMGVPQFIVASVLNGVVAQRLVRRLCERCKAPEAPRREWLRLLMPEREPDELLERSSFHAARGCEHCNHTGYRGRIPIYEFLELDEVLRAKIAAGATAPELRRAALARNFQTMQKIALRRILAGETSLEEAIRAL